jgi:uncharacterized protein
MLSSRVRVHSRKQYFDQCLSVLASVMVMTGCGQQQTPPPAHPATPAISQAPSAAEAEWLAQAEAGDDEAQYRLGLLYLNGIDSPKDSGAATEKFREAANSYLNANAQTPVSSVRAAPDAGKALKWLSLSAAQGNHWAQPLLAELYRYGKGTPTNITEAIKWYETSAKDGNQWSAYELALINVRGEGGAPKDVEQAVKWYEQAAEAGIVWAQYELATLYDKSKEIPRDYAKAAHWYELAAKQDHDWSEYGLAELYYYGRGQKKDYETAFKWYQRAAERGNAEAEYMLGFMLNEGRGCERDHFEAGKWLYLAVDTGKKPHYQEAWLLIRSHLSEKEMAEIRLHAAQFKPKKKAQ